MRSVISRVLTVKCPMTCALLDFGSELVDKSGRELHSMFTRTYGILYQQNSQVFNEFFRDLRNYFRGSDLVLSDVLEAFFSSLLLRMFTLLNAQYSFDERYLGCIGERSQDLVPFGDVPQKLGIQVKRAFVAAKTFRHGLAVGQDVISSLSKVCWLFRFVSYL
jgi:Glypican